MRRPQALEENGWSVTAMATRRKRLRGLADLRTLSGLGSRDVAPHTAYMKITSLELEKLRLGRVRQNALRRIAQIDERCEDIQAEKAALLAAANAPQPAGPAHSRASQLERASRLRRGNGLTLRY